MRIKKVFGISMLTLAMMLTCFSLASCNDNNINNPTENETNNDNSNQGDVDNNSGQGGTDSNPNQGDEGNNPDQGDNDTDDSNQGNTGDDNPGQGGGSTDDPNVDDGDDNDPGTGDSDEDEKEQEALLAARASAKTEISEYAENKLIELNKKDDGSLEALILEVNEEFDSVSTIEAINTVLLNAKIQINELVSKLPVEKEDDSNVDVLSYVEGLNESIALEWNSSIYPEETTKVYYRQEADANYTLVDDELVRDLGNKVRTDILGLKAGTYSIKLENGSNSVVKNDIVVRAQDRSGYAHFNVTKGVGGYNNDGTVKDDAVIIYVDDNNKNTVTATLGGKTYTGLSNIMAAQNENIKTPLIVRVLGMIATPTWNSKTLAETEPLLAKLGKSNVYEDEIISNGINTLNYNSVYGQLTKLEGLDNRAKYSAGDCDSVFNTMNVKNASNITLEGVGTNAMFFQWGLTWKNCSYIEVKNITFDDYPEDACSFEGSQTSCTTLSGFETGHIWIHNNTFNQGMNYWDLTAEQDKHEGDGATDFKGNAYITVSYNHYYNAHKTGLVGGGDAQTTACLTYHHNYYQNNGSRLPLGRRANMHMYNNYYYGSTGTNMSIRNGAYALIEGCYFENVNNVCEVKGSALSAAKSYNNTIVSCKGTNNMTTVTSRTQTVSNENVYGQTFDIDSSIFYYDDVNKVSDVAVLTDAETAKNTCLAYSGVLKENATAYPMSSDSEIIVPPTPEVPEDDTVWNTLYSNDFSTSQTFGTTPIINSFYYETTLASDKTCSNGVNNISITNGMLFIEDTDTGCVTNAYLKFNPITSGKMKISMDVLYEGDFPAKWTAIQCLNTSNNEFIGIRSGSSANTIGYRVDGGDVGSTVSISNSTAFNVTITIDVDSKSAVISINGTSYSVDLSSSERFDGISGIKLFTATNARSFYIDNVFVQTA